MDPIRQITSPVAEVQVQAQREIDEYGEEWVVIDGIETKVPRIKAAQHLLTVQDDQRAAIRRDLDALGVRDRTEKVEITLDDGTVTEVDLLPPGNSGANVLQIGKFSDPVGLQIEAAHAQAKANEKLARLQDEAEKASQPWYAGPLNFLRSLGR